MSIFLNKDSKVIVQGITGGEGSKHTARMLAAGTQVLGGVNARKAGTTVSHKDAQGADVELPLDTGFEHAVLASSGDAEVAGAPLGVGTMLYLGTGRRSVRLRSTGPSRLLLLGGEPFEEQIVMWWNFIGRSHDEIVDYRERWQQARETGGGSGGDDEGDRGDYGPFPDAWSTTLPAPELPNLRLRSRG